MSDINETLNNHLDKTLDTIRGLHFVKSFSLDGNDVEFNPDYQYIKVKDLEILLNLIARCEAIDDCIEKLNRL